MNDATPIRYEDFAERAPVRIWDLILPLLASLVPFLLGMIAVLLVAFTQTNGVSQQSVRTFFADLGSNFIAAQVFMGIVYLAMLGGIWAVARRRGPATVSGYFSHVPRHTMLFGVLGGIAMAALVLGIIWWLDAYTDITFHTTTSEEKLLMAHNLWQLAVSLVVVAIIAPFTEELYFRGLLLSWLRRWLWLPIAALSDAAIFGLVHARFVNHPGPEGWILTAMVGLVGLLNVGWYVRVRSLWPAFLTHAFYNGVLVTLAYLSA